MNRFLNAPIEKKPYVSRAGAKLAAALDAFDVVVRGKTCADFGASTGGFTDCLLQRAAAKVYAIDTGHGMLDWKLREDGRVVVMEKTNAMHVELPEPVDIVTIDVGWTKQKNILTNAVVRLKPDGDIISLVKPHYEATPRLLTKGVLAESDARQALEEVEHDIEELELSVCGRIESPIQGRKGGNIEYLLWLRKK